MGASCQPLDGSPLLSGVVWCFREVLRRSRCRLRQAGERAAAAAAVEVAAAAAAATAAALVVIAAAAAAVDPPVVAD
jgi:hypothetical protein